jgi:hypothetical protein
LVGRKFEDSGQRKLFSSKNRKQRRLMNSEDSLQGCETPFLPQKEKSKKREERSF